MAGHALPDDDWKETWRPQATERHGLAIQVGRHDVAVAARIKAHLDKLRTRLDED